MANDGRYTPLAGSGRSLGGVHTVWLARDHLLFVERRATVEEYRRIRLDEVEAIAVAPTDRFAKHLLIWLALLLPFVLGVAFSGPVGRVAWALAAVPIVAGTLVHLLGGPTCAVTIRTRVQALQPRAWRRRRAVERALAEVLPRIERVQGLLESRSALLEPGAVVPAAAIAGGEPKVAPSGPFSARAHQALVASLLVAALASAWAAIADSTWSDWLSSAAFLVVFITVLTALIRQTSSGAGDPLRRWTWSVLAIAIVRFVAQSVAPAVQSFTASLAGEEGNPLELIGRMPAALDWGFAGALFLLAAAGLVVLRAPGRDGV